MHVICAGNIKNMPKTVNLINISEIRRKQLPICIFAYSIVTTQLKLNQMLNSFLISIARGALII